ISQATAPILILMTKTRAVRYEKSHRRGSLAQRDQERAPAPIARASKTTTTIRPLVAGRLTLSESRRAWVIGSTPLAWPRGHRQFLHSGSATEHECRRRSPSGRQ